MGFEKFSPGDIAVVIKANQAWSFSDKKYEDWIEFDAKKSDEIVIVISLRENLKSSRLAHVLGSSGSFFINEKFLKKA
jgi:hypothetical protein